ncbi:four helix bundle protein [Jiulongibacter sediminis]|uniref:S23 ribosomal protein n=1 Tax=Jiulongibacter sediminis TaxID=1605367 RepID=A0A0P7C7J3_9BACT|nr:four helix bundle protein [Jiulongibacter sediminis]KPM48385.1 S23 ribosomal protein [Jiulongibacter sediminis]TBX24923.1 S23 ribosomal protein [Jiulongibacter sediminis]
MNFKDLMAYKLSFQLAMEVFETSKSFPIEERYSLTDQIRRSSRSVSVNLAEAYRKIIYPAHFRSKLTDSDGENSETQVWLDFAVECKYINKEQHLELSSKTEEVGKLLNYMINNPEKFGSSKTRN